jgi:hypothetical protein
LCFEEPSHHKAISVSLTITRVFRRCLLKNCAQNLQLFAGGLGKTLFFHPEVEGYIALIKQNFAAIFQKHLVVIYKPWDMIQMTPSGVV